MPDDDVPWLPRAAIRRIGVVVPQQGPAGIFGPSCVAAAQMAAAELNRTQGIRGEAVELVIIDGGASPEVVRQALRRELMGEGLNAVTGWHISSVRRAIVPLLGGVVPYVYPALYEGGERRPGVFCTGEVPEAQVEPALRWLWDEVGVRRWFIVGNDYVWPRRTAASVMAFVRREGMAISGVGFVRLPAPAEEMSALLDRVQRSGCDGVLMLFPGQDGVEFNRQFSARGLHHEMVRFSPLMDENMLMATGPEATVGLFSAAGYFSSLLSGGALDFQGRFVDAFGVTAPALNALAESTYSAIHVVAALAERAGSLAVPRLSSAIQGLVVEVPRGRLTFQGQDAVQDVYLAAANGCDFEIVSHLKKL